MTARPILIACRGGSPLSQTAERVVEELERRGLVRAGDGSALPTGGEIVTLDGCPSACLSRRLAAEGRPPSMRLNIADCGVERRDAGRDRPGAGRGRRRAAARRPDDAGRARPSAQAPTACGRVVPAHARRRRLPPRDRRAHQPDRRLRRADRRRADAGRARLRPARREPPFRRRDARPPRGVRARPPRHAQGAAADAERTGRGRPRDPPPPAARGLRRLLPRLPARGVLRARADARRRVRRRLARAPSHRLGDPARCPHGWPVDPAAARAEGDALVSLAALGPGEAATVARVTENDASLQRLVELGIVPGARVAARAGGGALDVEGRTVHVEDEEATAVLVRLTRD